LCKSSFQLGTWGIEVTVDIQFMKPAFEHWIMLQALTVELKRCSEEASHGKTWSWDGLGSIPHTHLGASAWKSAPIRWAPCRQSSHEDLAPTQLLSFRQCFIPWKLLGLSFTHVFSLSLGLPAFRLSSMFFLSSQTVLASYTNSLFTPLYKNSLLSLCLFLDNKVDPVYLFKREPPLLVTTKLLPPLH